MGGCGCGGPGVARRDEGDRVRVREQGLLRIDWGARKAAGGTDDIMSAFALRETLRRRRQAVATRIRMGDPVYQSLRRGGGDDDEDERKVIGPAGTEGRAAHCAKCLGRAKRVAPGGAWGAVPEPLAGRREVQKVARGMGIG